MRCVLFTTMRVRHGEPWFFDDHVARLEGRVSADSLRDAIAEAVTDLTDARVRVFAPRDGPWRVEAFAYSAPDRPWRLYPVVVSPDETVRRKTTSRATYDVARAAARTAASDDALLELPDGTVLEATVANVFFVDGSTLRTPHRSAPLLAGIARARVMAAARELGMEVREERVTAETARRADAVFCTNALFVAHEVAAIEGVARYPGTCPWTRRLREFVTPGTP